jgi:membrane protease YdiL (CAAX protease family)
MTVTTVHSQPSDQTTDRTPAYAILGWALLVMAGYATLSAIAHTLVDSLALEPRTLWKTLLAGIAPTLPIIALVIAIQHRRSGGTWSEALHDLGLAWPHPRALLVGLLGATPIFLVYGLVFGVMGQSAALVPFAGLLLLRFILGAGIVEELVFRGFVFRQMRRGRGFWHAASLSGAAFGLAHLFNFMNGFTLDIAVSVLASVILGFVLTFPAAALFERSGNHIWGFVVTHVIIDSINLFALAFTTPITLGLHLLAVLLTAILTPLLARRLLPPPGRPDAAGAGSLSPAS